MSHNTILLVEDNADDEILTLRALKKSHNLNDVLVARDGVEALQCLSALGARGDLPQVVLLDLNLPRLDGMDVLRCIRTDPLTKLLPVIVLTSSKQEEDVIQSYQLGANSYVRKPVDFQEFAEAVRQLERYWLVLNQRPPKSLPPI